MSGFVEIYTRCNIIQFQAIVVVIPFKCILVSVVLILRHFFIHGIIFETTQLFHRVQTSYLEKLV